MQAIAEERSALHGRFDLRLPAHPFRPHEAALMLRDLKPAERALVRGICGGTPLYLSWWDQSADLLTNVRRLTLNGCGWWSGLSRSPMIPGRAPAARRIDRGLGPTIAKLVVKRLDDHMGARFEEAFRDHLRRLAAEGELGDEVAAIGPFWTRGGSRVEIDAVVLSGLPETAVAVGESKWQQRVSGAALRAKLLKKAKVLPQAVAEPEVIICAGETVDDAASVRAITAANIFDLPVYVILTWWVRKVYEERSISAARVVTPSMAALDGRPHRELLCSSLPTGQCGADLYRDQPRTVVGEVSSGGTGSLGDQTLGTVGAQLHRTHPEELRERPVEAPATTQRLRFGANSARMHIRKDERKLS